jgi:hypothetical protein
VTTFFYVKDDEYELKIYCRIYGGQVEVVVVSKLRFALVVFGRKLRWETAFFYGVGSLAKSLCGNLERVGVREDGKVPR